MAFNTIGWKGVGVITSCESVTGWAEDGGGTISVNPDQFLQGSASIGNTYANKTGNTYYTHGTAYDFTTTYNGQKLYMWVSVASNSAFAPINGSTDGLSIIMGASNTALRRWNIVGSDETNGWTQGWKLFVIDPNNTGSVDDGAYAATAVDTFGLWVDTDVSVRADTIFIDEFAVADGMEAHSGTGTFDDIITYVWKTPATRVIGVFTENGRFIYALDKFTLGNSTTATADSVLTVTNKVIGFNNSEYWDKTNGWSSSSADDLYNVVHLAKHASYATTFNSVNTSWFGNTTAWLTFSKDAGATYNFDGGTLEKVKAFTHDSDWTIQNAVLNDVESVTITGGTFSSNTVSASDTVTLATSIANCVFSKPNSTAVITSSLNNLDNCRFVSAGTGHAVQLTGTGTFNWSCTLSGYDAGSTGDNVGTSSTNAAIYVTATSGTVDINVDGGTIPSVRSAGATVNVSAGLVTLTLTGLVPNTEVRILEAGTENILDGVEDSGTTFPYTYTYSAGTFVDIVVHNPLYLYTAVLNYELGSTNGSLPIKQQLDRNYVNN